mmetsp:Transcript_11940/g.26187  ORF Transcript_11940/g.26187 Transcript_11940/m.26187 type:complete len:140 (-) Transcript_11940:3072-3491(-)
MSFFHEMDRTKAKDSFIAVGQPFVTPQRSIQVLHSCSEYLVSPSLRVLFKALNTDAKVKFLNLLMKLLPFRFPRHPYCSLHPPCFLHLNLHHLPSFRPPPLYHLVSPPALSTLRPAYEKAPAAGPPKWPPRAFYQVVHG